MWLILLSWKNMWRNRQRTLIIISALFFSVVLSVLSSSLKAGIFDNLIRNMVSYYAGYIQVHKRGYWEERTLDNGMKVDDRWLHQLERAFVGVKFSQRLESFSLASFGKNIKGCMVVGIEPLNENKITKLGVELMEGKSFGEDSSGVLLAAGLKNRLQLELGDSLVLLSQGYHGSFAAGQYLVRGVFRSGLPDLNNNLLLLPLRLSQELFAADSVATTLVIQPPSNVSISKVVTQLRQELGDAFEVMSWDEMMPDIKQHVEADSINLQIIQGILYLLICFGIFGTFLMMMQERRQELGMLLAIGMNKKRMMLMILIESMMTVVAGCLLGIVASLPLVFYLYQHPIRLGGSIANAYERFGFEPIFPASLAAQHFWIQGIVVSFLGIILSFYPLYSIWRMEAVQALKK